MPNSAHIKHPLQLADSVTMHGSLAKITDIDDVTTTLIDSYAGRKVPIMEIYSAAAQFCHAKGLTHVRYLLFFKKPALPDVMASMLGVNSRRKFEEALAYLIKQIFPRQ